MQNLISLFSELSEEDAEWIFSTASEHQFFEKAVVIEAGSESTAIYFVLEGLLGVFEPNFTGNRLATVGPGECVGEMSFVEKQAAGQTVAAVESSVVLVLPRAELEAKLTADKGFASRFHLGLAKLLSRRLRRTTARLDAQSLADNVAESGPWKPLQTELTQFKALMKQADDAALSNDGIVPSDLAGIIRKRFQEFVAFMNKEIGDAASLSPQMKEEFGSRLQQELLPYLFLTANGERLYSKPRGYAGDFLSIEQIYGDTSGGFGRLGALLDRCVLDCPSGIAVRNRRGLLAREIRKTLTTQVNGPAQVTSLASGPAREFFDVFVELQNPKELVANLVDMDLQALAFVADKRDKLKLRRQMSLHNENLIYLALGRKSLVLGAQDLVYSVGLIDYFDDEMVVNLLNWIHRALAPGGRVILGNFHPNNPTKAFMDHVLEWKLIHRTEEDMDRIFQKSSFERGPTAIYWEPSGINLFAECVKQ